MAEAGTITVKLELDTTEAKAKLAELRKEAEGLRLSRCDTEGVIDGIKVTDTP